VGEPHGRRGIDPQARHFPVYVTDGVAARRALRTPNARALGHGRTPMYKEVQHLAGCVIDSGIRSAWPDTGQSVSFDIGRNPRSYLSWGSMGELSRAGPLTLTG
jgi:hypothetical protein